MGDALKLDIAGLVDKKKLPNKLISNLPYNISSTLLIRYLEKLDFLKDYTIMVQKEVADRMVANPGSKDYGAFTVKLNFLAVIVRKFNISKNVFIPVPNVESSLISIERRNDIDPAFNEKLFRLIEASFCQRRKKLINSVSETMGLKKDVLFDALSRCGIDNDIRAEMVSPNDYKRLFLALENNYHPSSTY